MDEPARLGKMGRAWLLVALAVTFALLVWLVLTIGPSVAALQSDLSKLHEAIETVREWREANRVLAALIFLAVFGIGGALPLPVVTVMSLAGGAFFGFLPGMVLSVVGTTLSATLAFLVARHLLNRPLRRWLGMRAAALDKAVKRNGTMALLSLRLTPALPFLVINLAAGVSRMRLAIFVPVTALGVLPNKAILTLAGTSLAEIDQLSDIWGPRLIAILLALAALPWVARWVMRRFERPDDPAGDPEGAQLQRDAGTDRNAR